MFLLDGAQLVAVEDFFTLIHVELKVLGRLEYEHNSGAQIEFAKVVTSADFHTVELVNILTRDEALLQIFVERFRLFIIRS